MTHKFPDAAQQGKNAWWRYVLTILCTVLGVAIANVGLAQILPGFKSLFPDNQFGKDLGMSILIGVVFSIALLAFALAARKLHQRSFSSFINLDGRFDWRLYLSGLFVWGVLLFLGALPVDWDTFQTFLSKFNTTHFLILLAVGFVSIGIQSFFEEVVIRGYFLQGLHLKIKTNGVLVTINAMIFGLLHFGYGIQGFIHSFTFGVAFAIVIIKQNRIEFAAGAHNANNLLLSLVFLDIADATNAGFSWSINWLEMGIHLITLSVMVAIAFKWFAKTEDLSPEQPIDHPPKSRP